MTSVLNKLVDTFKMGSIDEEERQYLQDVEAVKQWWTDSRWRYTKRPFTAEQIVQKRGTIKIQYPSNAQAKKLWKLIENRYAVSSLSVWPPCDPRPVLTWDFCPVDQNRLCHIWLPRTHHAYPDEQISRHRLCLWLAILIHSIIHR